MKRYVSFLITIVLVIAACYTDISILAAGNEVLNDTVSSQTKTMLKLSDANNGHKTFPLNTSVLKADIEYTVSYKYHFTEQSWEILTCLYLVLSNYDSSNGQYSAVRETHYDNSKVTTTYDFKTVTHKFKLTSEEIKQNLHIGFWSKVGKDIYISDFTMYESSDDTKKNILPKDEYCTDVSDFVSRWGIIPNVSYVEYDENLFIPKQTMFHYNNPGGERSGLKLNAGTFEINTEYTFSFKYKLGNGCALLPELVIYGNNGGTDYSSPYTYIIYPGVISNYISSVLDGCTATYTFVVPDEALGYSDYHIGFVKQVNVYLSDIKLYKYNDYNKTNLLELNEYSYSTKPWQSNSGVIKFEYVDYKAEYFRTPKTMFKYSYYGQTGYTGLQISKTTLKPNTEYTVSYKSYGKEMNIGNFTFFGSYNSMNPIYQQNTSYRKMRFKSQVVNKNNATFKFSLTQEQYDENTFFCIGFVLGDEDVEFYLYDFVLYESNNPQKTNILPKNEYSTSRSGWRTRYNSENSGNGGYVIYGSGDANMDGIIDVRDIVNMKKTISQLEFNPFADLDVNESINATDLSKSRYNLINSEQEKINIPNDFDWLSVHGANLSEPATGYAEEEAETLKNKILTASNTETLYKITGTKYYFSSNGDDNNNGLTPETPFKTLRKIDYLALKDGDAILLERNSVFRITSTISLKNVKNLTIGSYGQGEKPRIYGSPKDFSVGNYWTCTEKENVWKADFQYTDACGMFFDHGKEIGSLWRKNVNSLTKNGDFHFDKASEAVYLYFDKGNPADYYKSIEILPSGVHILNTHNASNLVIDNLCLKYTGGFPYTSSGDSITVTNCEIGYTGGLWNGKVRYGNGIEFSTTATNIKVENNWIYQIFDTALTWQDSTESAVYKNISFKNNLLEYNNSDIEFYTQGTSLVENFYIENNIMRFTSMGWGTQDEEGGIRSIEGCISAHTYQLNNVGLITFKNNIMDCPSRWVINWRSANNQNLNIETANNALYIKSSYRSTGVVLRGLAKTDEHIANEISANNADETMKAFERFDNTIDIHWYDE